MKAATITRGRWLVIAVFCLFVIMELFGLILNYAVGRPVSLTSTIVPLTLTILMFVLIHKGYEWAKLIVALLSMLAGFISVYTLYIVLTRNLSIWGLGIALVEISVWSLITATLLFSDSVAEFTQDQKAKRLEIARQSKR